MTTTSIQDIYPLSPLQQGFLFHTIYSKQTKIYCQQLSCSFLGGLNCAAFRKAWQQVVDRHPILRTSFVWEDLDQPLQVVHSRVQLPLEQHDWRFLDEGKQEVRLEELVGEESLRRFELDKPPLLRLVLVRLGEANWRFVFNFHHLLLDGWSLPVIFREVFTLYAAATGASIPLLRPTHPYSAYIDWLQRQDLAQAEKFWRSELAGFNSPTPLGVGRKRKVSPGENDYHEEQHLLPAELTERLTAFAREYHVTLNTLLQGAWGIVLSRYSGTEDVLFGAVVSGRPAELPEVDSMVGLFINTQPVRVRVTPEIESLQFFKELHEKQFRLRQYEYTPLVEVQGWSDVARGVPLFDSIVIFENYPVHEALKQRMGDLVVRDIRTVERTNYPLTLVAMPGERFLIRYLYDCGCFDTDTISRLHGHLRTVFEALVAGPRQRLGDLVILTRDEMDLLAQWNEIRSFPEQRTLTEIFQARVKENPDAVALVHDKKQMTYRELNERSNRLAHVLNRNGVGPEILVGICLERSLEMVVAILAALKAGGAYLPLDPAYPGDRLRFMLKDAGVLFLLTLERWEEGLAAPGRTMICLDRDLEVIEAEASRNPDLQIDAENAAYVIYTSGSTGKPKGVVVSHHNVTRLLAATQGWFDFSGCDVWALFHSYAFDFSVWELWGPLCYGGRLVVVSYLVSRNPDAFYQLLAEEEVTVLNQTPSAFRQLIQAEEWSGAQDLSLRLVIFGGEALEPGYLKSWFERHGDRVPQLVNMYGITETTVHVTYRPVRSGDPEAVSAIGIAIPDLQLFLLDDYLQPVPVGVAGEIHVGGAGLARGYLNHPELTADRFLPHPFSSEPGARIYRSGDLARYLPDGSLEYLGRKDHQVKVRGFRIELGEIEAALTKRQQVREAVVLAALDGDGNNRLVAYLCCREPAPSQEELRGWLKADLPDYMIPAGFCLLESLPLTVNGKVDRKALSELGQMCANREREYVAPRNQVERTLAGIWAEVLGLVRVGINDNFFELGGDSILSIRVVAKAGEAGLKLTPKELFENQTVAELGAVIEAAPIRVEQGIVTGGVPLTPIQYWFFEQELPEPQHWNQAVMMETRETLEPEWLAEALRRLIEHHDALRLRFRREEPNWCQELPAPAPDEKPTVACFDLSDQPAERHPMLMEERAGELNASLDLTEGPLLRLALFHLGAGCTGRLLLVIHHLAVDGVSWRVFLEDLQTAYGQLSRGEEVRLPAKTTSVKAWSERLVEMARSKAITDELPYWSMAVPLRPSRLPVDFPEGENLEAAEENVTLHLTEEETRSLLQEAQQAYHTRINDLLLTALAQTLVDWTGEPIQLIDLEGHGREELDEELDLSRTVGWFTSLYPVALDSGIGTGAGEALKRVKEQLRRVPRSGIGYGLLRYLGGDEARRTLQAQRPAEVCFNYLGQFQEVFGAGGAFALALEGSGAIHSPKGKRPYLFEVGGAVVTNRLRIVWAYNGDLHRRGTVERLAARFMERLRELIRHCVAQKAPGYTPSDFPDLDLSEADLRNLMEELG